MGRRFLLLFFILALGSMFVSADSGIPDFHVEVSAGFNGIYTANSWIPFTLFVETKLPSFSGMITLKLLYGDIYTSKRFYYSVSKELFLTVGQKKRLQITLPLQQANKLEIFIEEDKKTVFSDIINLSPLPGRNHRLLIPGNSTDFDFLRNIIGKGSIKYQTIYTHPDMLPETAAGFSSIDSVVLHGTRLSGLSEDRSEALRNWVRNGGKLFITGSINRRGDLPPTLSDLLPVDLIGPAFADLSSSVWFSDIGPGVTRDFPFTRVSVRKDSTLILEADGNPIIAYREEGYGRVFYISINPGDPGYRNWKKKQAFWDYILNIGKDRKPYIPVYNPIPELNELLVSELPSIKSGTNSKFLFIFIPLPGFVFLILFRRIKGVFFLIILILYPLIWGILLLNFFPSQPSIYFETDILNSRLNKTSGHLYVLGNFAVYDAGMYALKFSSPLEWILPDRKNSMNVKYTGDNPVLEFYMKSWDKRGFLMDVPYISEFTGSAGIDGDNVTAEIFHSSAASLKYPIIYYKDIYTDDFILLKEKDKMYISFNIFSERGKTEINRSDFPEYYKTFLSYIDDVGFLNAVTEKDSIIIIFQLSDFLPVTLTDTDRRDNKAFILLEIEAEEFFYEE